MFCYYSSIVALLGNIALITPFKLIKPTLPCCTFAFPLAVHICACGGDGVSQRHERHLLHTGQAWEAGMKKVTG